MAKHDWNAKDLNIEPHDPNAEIELVTIQFVVPSGRYTLAVEHPAYALRLKNMTTNTTVAEAKGGVLITIFEANGQDAYRVECYSREDKTWYAMPLDGRNSITRIE